jgi:hypothetical protein
MKVCRAFQIRSKAGILSAKNSMTKSAALAAMMGQACEQLQSRREREMAEAGQQAEDGERWRRDSGRQRSRWRRVERKVRRAGFGGR